MNKSSKTRKAFLASVMALALCFVMLIGTTFAWFTDTATIGVNKIQAGNLEIDLQKFDATEQEWVSVKGETIDFVKAEGHTDEDILWEPGCTYSLPTLRVKNNGNLALKYKLVITGINGDATLNEAIDWTLNNADVSTEYHLAAGATSEDISISGHMQETAGNEYQGLSIDGIAITVVATQYTVEYDSTTNLYDAGATYPAVVSNTEELSAAITQAEDGDTIALTDGTYIMPNNITSDITIIGNENTVVSLPQQEGPWNRLNTSSATIKNVTFNEPVTLTGGASFENVTFAKGTSVCTINADTSFTNCTFSNTTGTDQFGMHIDSGNGTANVSFKDCTFEKGAVGYSGLRSVLFDNCTFNGMKGETYSWLYIRAYSDTTLTNCTFVDPAAAIKTADGALITLNNTVVTVQ